MKIYRNEASGTGRIGRLSRALNQSMFFGQLLPGLSFAVAGTSAVEVAGTDYQIWDVP